MYLNKKIITSLVAIFFALSTFSVIASDFRTTESGIAGLPRFISENPGLIVTEHFSTVAYERNKLDYIDEPYERGKSLYLGEGDSPKLSYCVNYKGNMKKVKRKSMSAYKQGTMSELSKQLYSCDDPNSKIINEMPRKDFLYVMYYLDVKYKLNLKRL